MARPPSNRNVTANEADVKDNSNQGKKGNTTQTDCQDDGEEKVEHRSAGHALDCSDPVVDWHMVIGEDGKEVREDAESDDGTDQLEKT